MPGMNVISSATLVAGIRSEFVPTYERMYKGIQDRLAPMVKFVPSDKASETFAWFESAPAWKIWRAGESITSKPFKDSSFTVLNRDWGIKLEWRENDKNDDQTRSLMTRAREAGSSGPLLHERVLFQMLQGSTDNDLLPSVPNAADGSSLFSSSTRFGATGGNSLTGSGVASGPAIVLDFFRAKAQLQKFKDTESQPLWDPSVFDAGFVVYFNSDNERVFTEAFRQAIQAYANSTSNAGVSNLPQASGLNVTLVPTQRITTDDWFVGLKGCPDGKQPFVILERQTPRELTALVGDNNSDSARNTKVESIQWDARFGYGIATPYALVRLDN